MPAAAAPAPGVRHKLPEAGALGDWEKETKEEEWSKEKIGEEDEKREERGRERAWEA